MQNRYRFLRGCLAAATFAFLSFAVSAQTSNVQPRITAAINESQLTTLRGNTHPYARPQFDRGAAPDSLPMQRMLLVLKRSPAQEAALDTLMEQQQDQSSPNYHAWLTPQQFGQQFGPADADIQTITSWLESRGFTVNRVSNGRTVIEFSGTAGQVRAAFHAEIHRYNVNNEDHWANASDPQIPTALTPVVAGIDSLYNFPRHAMHHVAGVVSRSKATGRVLSANPLFTLGGGCGLFPNCYGVTPYDFATIYNVLPLWNATPATDGTGQTIAIVAESDISLTDISSFRSYFSLPANNPTVILDGPDPGTVQGDETESDLDIEWSGAIAKGATIDVVTSASTETSLGVDLSAQYVVDNDLAPILSESYGICELFLGSAGNQFYNQLWQQAAAEGITALVATGDSGSAVCDRNAGTQGAAQYGLSVSGISSTPYNVAVGGTDFFDLTNPNTYWSSTNSIPPGAPAGTPATLSALSYIPETTWNDSCTNAVFGTLLGYSQNAETNCNNQQLISNGFVNTVAGSGGRSGCTTYDGTSPSSCTGGYAKPSWQAGAGVPADGKRYVPDVSLFAASGSPSGAFYLICEADALPAGYPSCDPANPGSYFLGIGGTSASTPAFAGIMALVDQKTGSRQGNANYILYKLAAQSGASCNSSSGAGTNCAFYDVTNGTIAMPCVTGSPNCKTSTSGDAVGVLSGYPTASGYDPATGLGSVNASNLVKNWNTVDTTTLKTSTTTLTLNNGNAVNITHGQPVPVTIGVTGTGGTPSGNVSLIANTGPDGTEGVQGFVLSSGSASGTTDALPGGTYSVVANYAGDATFGESQSSGTSVTVGPEASKVSIAYELIDPNSGAITNSNATTAVFGTPSLLRVNVTGQAGDACANNAAGSSGCPTGSVTLTDNGTADGTFALNSLGYTEDQTIDLTGGTHTIAAGYAGDASFKVPSPNPTTASLTITPVSTQTSFLASPATVTVGGNVTFFANINVPNAIFSQHAPTGTVTFYSGTTQVASGPVSGAVEVTGYASGSATVSTTTLPHGQLSITAKYSGDASYSGSTSPAYNVAVLYPSATTIASSASSIQYGQSVTLTAHVTTTQTGGPPITGTVQFMAGDVDVGPVGPPVTLSNGQAQLNTNALPGETTRITAQYSGDTNYYTSIAAPVALNVARLSTSTALTASSGTATQGASVTFTATVTPSTTGPLAPTGLMQFLSNGSGIGSATVNPSNGQAQLTTAGLAVGTDQVTAMYSGDDDYTASTSAAVPETITAPPTFTVTANPTAIPVTAPGQSGTTMLTFTGQNGFSSNGAVTVTPMCSGLPSETTCSSGASITIPTNGTAMAMVTFQTTAPSAVFPASRDRRDIGGWPLTAGTLALACLLCATMLAFGYREKRQRWGIALMFAVFALLAVSAGCGGGGGGNTGPPPNPGTPVGAYNGVSVMVTINGVTQTIPGLTINVQ